jgi:hypothetical protein
VFFTKNTVLTFRVDTSHTFPANNKIAFEASLAPIKTVFLFRGEKSMSKSSDPRVDRMYAGDRGAAILALGTLWATYLFVFWELLPLVGDSTVLYVLAAGAGLVLLFNTASIVAMLAHYSEDRSHIYGLDLHYLDEMKKSRG